MTEDSETVLAWLADSLLHEDRGSSGSSHGTSHVDAQEAVLEWIVEAGLDGSMTPPIESESTARVAEEEAPSSSLTEVEPSIGQLRLANTQQLIAPHTATPIHTGRTLDEALSFRVPGPNANTLVRGPSFLGAGRFEVFEWGGGAVRLPEPPTTEIDTLADVLAITINGGAVTYVPSVATPPVIRWVSIPRLRHFLALPNDDRATYRSRWIRQLTAAGAPYTRAQLEAASMPALRILLANHAARAFPVSSVRRGTPPQDRGGIVNGVTVPILRYPLVEPECYLSVVSEVEGRLESVNAWDAGAGVSLGPIQFNAQRAALFRFLWQVWEQDRHLFTTALGSPPLNWSMRRDGDHPDLVVAAAAPQTLHGREAEMDVARNVRYLQSGVAGGAGFDPIFRRVVAERLRNVVVWPHVQEWVTEVSAWWLQPGLTLIHGERGIAPLDNRAPDRATFVLKALLLSAYVRFSGCLRPLLEQLRRWPTAHEKLANWQTALASTNPTCRGLQARLVRQERDADRVFRAIQRLRAAG